MLELGLSRMSKLVTASKLPWRAVHVAGTNGKGSVCMLASSLLRACGASVGCFTSPHLIERWDGISINGQPIDQKLFLQLEREVLRKNESAAIGATEFELLTAVAFEAFSRAKVQAGVVEVGLGGREDATNVLKNPFTTVITKIGKDHQALLGDSLQEIASHKAGILKPGSPCFVDGSNAAEVKQAILEVAQQIGAGEVTFVDPESEKYTQSIWKTTPKDLYAEHQRMNIALAYEAALSASPALGLHNPEGDWGEAIKNSTFPARLQFVSLEEVIEREEPVLLDGAHNPQSAEALGQYVDGKIRTAASPVTWILAATQGKDLRGILQPLLHDGDNFVVTSFGAVDGMPWIEAERPSAILEHCLALKRPHQTSIQVPVLEALQTAAELADGGPMVIAGSLYLASDVLRLLGHGRPV